MDFDYLYGLLNLLGYIPIWETMVSFLALMIILLLSLIYTKLHWVLKALMILSSLGVLFLGYTSITNSFGWPFRGDLPDTFKIVYLDVQEPTRANPGAIRLWVKSVDPKKWAIASVPRVYEIPYTKDGHKQANEIRKKLREGEDVFGKKKGKGMSEGKGDGDGKGGKGKGKKDGKNGRNGQGMDGNGYDYPDGSGFGFDIIKPPVKAPPKDGEQPQEDDDGPKPPTDKSDKYAPL